MANPQNPGSAPMKSSVRITANPEETTVFEQPDPTPPPVVATVGMAPVTEERYESSHIARDVVPVLMEGEEGSYEQRAFAGGQVVDTEVTYGQRRSHVQLKKVKSIERALKMAASQRQKLSRYGSMRSSAGGRSGTGAGGRRRMERPARPGEVSILTVPVEQEPLLANGSGNMPVAVIGGEFSFYLSQMMNENTKKLFFIINQIKKGSTGKDLFKPTLIFFLQEIYFYVYF